MCANAVWITDTERTVELDVDLSLSGAKPTDRAHNKTMEQEVAAAKQQAAAASSSSSSAAAAASTSASANADSKSSSSSGVSNKLKVSKRIDISSAVNALVAAGSDQTGSQALLRSAVDSKSAAASTNSGKAVAVAADKKAQSEFSAEQLAEFDQVWIGMGWNGMGCDVICDMI